MRDMFRGGGRGRKQNDRGHSNRAMNFPLPELSGNTICRIGKFVENGGNRGGMDELLVFCEKMGRTLHSARTSNHWCVATRFRTFQQMLG